MFFQKYLNDLSDDLASNAKLFADDASLFSVVENMTKSARELNNDLAKISTWAFQRKMDFNPDPTKQVIFSRKLQNTNHPCLISNYNTVSLTESEKHFGIVLDSQSDFKEHLEIMFKKVSKTTGLLRKLQNLLLRKSLITVYKSFIRRHLDYGDIVYSQVYKASFLRN